MMLGMPMYENGFLTVLEDREVKRTWRERLCSRPRRPWKRTRVETVRVPDPSLYVVGGSMIVGHPTTIHRLRESLINRGGVHENS